MSLENLTTIPFKALCALKDYHDPKSFCAALAIDGLIDGNLSYGFWRYLSEKGVDVLRVHRIIHQFVAPHLGVVGNVGFCRGDQIDDRTRFVEELTQEMITQPRRLFMMTAGEISGHAQTIVSFPEGITVEYNALLPGYISAASQGRIIELLHETLDQAHSYFYALGFILNPKADD